jgi:hypothetical protein
MITRNLVRRLERLEERILPSRNIHLLRIVYANGPNGEAVGGFTIGPGCGPQDKWGICLNDETDH